MTFKLCEVFRAALDPLRSYEGIRLFSIEWIEAHRDLLAFNFGIEELIAPIIDVVNLYAPSAISSQFLWCGRQRPQ